MSERDELERLRKLKRLRELEAKAGGQPPTEPARGSEPLNYGNMMKSSLTNIVKGMATGGPHGAVLAGGQEALQNMGTLMERGGYKAGEMVTDALAPHVPANVAGAGGYAANVATQALPVLAGTLASKATLEPAMKWGSKRLMQSALKPSAADIRSGDAAKAVDTLLKTKANVTPGGVVKLQSLKDDILAQVQKMLDDLPEGTVVTKQGAANEIRKTLDRFRNQVNSADDVKAITKSWKEFNQSQPNLIPVGKAHELKTGTHTMLKNKAYGELKNADIEAQKALARGLRKDIEEVVPQVGPMNKKLGEVMNALKQTEYRVPMAANRDMAGLSLLAENPAAALSMMADRSPYVKSYLAQLLYHGSGPLATGTGAGAGMMYSQGQQP